jgi:hypothetical protein
MAAPTHQPAANVRELDPAGRVVRLHLSDAAMKPPDVLLRQEPMRGKDAVAEEADAVVRPRHDAFARMQPQTQPYQKFPDPFAQVGQFALVVGEDEKIVDVPNVAESQLILAK